MKNIFVLLLTLTFSLHTVSAFAGEGTLKEIVDEMNFDLSQVESSEAFQKVVTNYADKVKTIMDAATLEEQVQLRNELISLSHPKIAQDLNQMMSVVDFDKLSPAKQARMYATVIQNNSAQGASWEGVVAAIGVPILLLFAINGWLCGYLFDVWFGWVWYEHGCA